MDTMYRFPQKTACLLLIFSAALLGYACGENDTEDYGPPRVFFPQDEGGHPGYDREWWYANFHLVDPAGREYGAVVSYFNPPYRMMSVSDIQSEVNHHEFTLGAGSYSEGALDLSWGGQDRWYRTATDPSAYSLETYGSECRLDLTLTSAKPPLLVGGDGLLGWSSDQSTYYYSLTRLEVEGEIEIQGVTSTVTGIGWMDHQWGDFGTNLCYDWFSVQLDNDTEMIFWQGYQENGTLLTPDITMMLPDESTYYSQDLTVEKLETWTSPETGREYGIHWRLQETGKDIDLELEARFPEQEVTGNIITFWEGALEVSGTLEGEAASGVGYAELVCAYE